MRLVQRETLLQVAPTLSREHLDDPAVGAVVHTYRDISEARQRAIASMEAAVLIAPFVAGAVALVYGWFCVRLSGVYLAMLTLAFAQITWSVIFQLRAA